MPTIFGISESQNWPVDYLLYTELAAELARSKSSGPDLCRIATSFLGRIRRRKIEEIKARAAVTAFTLLLWRVRGQQIHGWPRP